MTNILPQLFLPTFNCKTTVHFESYEEPETSTNIPTTSTVNFIEDERIVEIESSISNLADGITGLESDVSRIENRLDEKVNKFYFYKILAIFLDKAGQNDGNNDDPIPFPQNAVHFDRSRKQTAAK